MKNFRRITLMLALGMTTLLTACSKTVRWEEEVLLNTGEMIWVKRSMVYSRQGGAGNPLDVRYRPSPGKDTIEFSWAGKTYHYKGRGGFKVLAIAPSGAPVLVKNADAGAWDAIVGYKCTIPFYAQFSPDESGQTWSWPPSIEPWLYNLPTNFLLDTGDPEKIQARYSRADKMMQPFWRDPQSLYMQKIDPAYTGDLCKKKEK